MGYGEDVDGAKGLRRVKVPTLVCNVLEVDELGAPPHCVCGEQVGSFSVQHTLTQALGGVATELWSIEKEGVSLGNGLLKCVSLYSPSIIWTKE